MIERHTPSEFIPEYIMMLYLGFTWTKITGKFASSKLSQILMFPEIKIKYC